MSKRDLTRRIMVNYLELLEVAAEYDERFGAGEV